MQNKLLSGSHKDHEKRRGCRFWLKRIKGLTGSHKARAREKGCSLCTLLTIILLTALIWSYEPHLATLLSPQEQFGLPIPDASEDAVKQDHAVRKSFHIRAETEDKLKPLIVEKTKYGVQKTPVSEESSTTQGSYASATKGYLANKKQEQELGKDSQSSFHSKEMKDESKPLVENVQNTNPADEEEPSTSKGSSTTQGSYASGESLEGQKEDKHSPSTFKKKETADKSEPQVQNVPYTKLTDEESSTSKGSSTTQVSSMTEESSATEGSNVTQESSARQKDDKDSSSTFQKKETVDKSKPQVQNVSNTKLVDEGSSTSDGSSTPQVSTMTQESSASEGTYATQESLPRQKEDKHSSSTFKKEDAPKPEDLPVQEPVLVDKETKDKTKSPSTSNENTKPLARQSFASEGSSATQGFAATKGLSTSKGSSPSKGSLTTDKEDKVPTSTYEEKDMAKSEDRRVQKPLLTRMEKEDKPKTQTDNNAENSKPMAKESSVSKESSAAQGSTATEGASASKDSSPTNGSFKAGKNDKVSAYTYEKKDVTKSEDRTVQEPFVTRSETKDKPKTQTDNVENKKQVAKDSFALKESSANQGSSEWASTTNGSSTGAGSPETKMENKVFASSSNDKKVCNYGKGRWVYDSKRPLYSGFKCKRWLLWMFACRLTVRPDFRFEHFRWQPANCEMPEFERSSVLKRMQNKTIAFVGDSIGRQQFHSFMCMLTGGEESPEVEDVGHEYGLRPKYSAFRFPQTNTTILYYWSSCLCDLVPLNSSDPKAGVAMHLDRPPAFLRDNIDKFDVLVLNTGHHWNRGKVNLNRWVMHLGGKPNQNKTLFNIGNAKDFTIFNIVRWVDSRLKSHPRGLKAFFTTLSPRHFFGGEWNTGGSCENTTPLVHGREVKQDESSDKVAANAVKGTEVNLLDITALSALRDEGHISKYGHKADSGVRDCLHWCLPGIPDTWNEILAAQI